MLKWIIGNPQRKHLVTMGLEDFNLDEEEEYLLSATEVADLMRDLNERGVSQTAAMGGALTQLLTQLFMGNPSQAEALGILASCLAAASENAEKFENLKVGLIDNENIH
jgi:hypothetical protein